MQLAGKLGGRGEVNAIRPGSLFFIKDSVSGVKFLVDTGASVSMLPGPSLPQSSSSLPLMTANGGRIATGAEKVMNMAFVGSDFAKHRYSWTFLFGNVDGPILGNDFIKHFKLLVDPADACLRCRGSQLHFKGVESFSLQAAAAALPPGVSELLHSFPELVSAGQQLPPPIHGVEHFLETSGPPVTARFRRLDAAKLAAAKQIFGDWEKAGIIQRSSSSWASPLHLVKKKDGSWRPCGDFRRLNLATTEDKYPVPNMGDFSGQMEGCTVFSKLDLKNGYLQIPLHPSAAPKTALITPFGLFEFKRMPFGLKNAGMSFQRLMDRVLTGLPFVFVYIDDILVASPDLSSHLAHLGAVFQRLKEAGLVLNVAKCEFARSSISFLGHRISASGSEPLEDKVEAITRHAAPTTVKELQQFLGMLNFYRKFIPKAAQLLCPLTDVLKGGPPGATKLIWSVVMTTAFVAAKAALANTCRLSHPVPTAELSLVCDASATHVGAVLQQRKSASCSWEPLGFFSRKLDRPQLVYSAYDRELFAAFAAVRHFRYQLEGRHFVLWTDHKPLLSSLVKVSESWTPRQQRQLAYLAEFNVILRHVAGADNVVADALSRPPASSVDIPVVSLGDNAISLFGAISRLPSNRTSHVCSGSGPGSGPGCSTPSSPPAMLANITGRVVARAPPRFLVDLAVVAAAQPGCAETTLLAASPSLTVSSWIVEGVKLLCDTSRGFIRPLVPASHRRLVFAAAHELAHPGIRATRRLICSRWVWKGMSMDIAGWCRDCQACQRAKVTRQPLAPLQPIAVPHRRFSHIHVDLVGPLPSSQGATHLLTVIDRSTRWLEALPLLSTTATAVADALVGGWIARFGVPAELTSDRGVQFTSEVWAQLMSRLGVKHHLTTAYHPQANGMIERPHRQLKDALKARLAGADWAAHLPWILLSLRATPKEDSAVSSAEMVYGAPILLPGQLQHGPEPPPAVFSEASRPFPTSIPTRQLPVPVAPSSTPAALNSAGFVYIRRGGVAPPLTPAYSGPYPVVSRSAKYFVVNLGDRLETVSIDRLKPHSGLAPTAPAVAPPRGRPRLSAARPDSPLGAG